MSDCIVARLSYDDVCEVFNINVNDYEYIVSEWLCNKRKDFCILN
jgi:hypothetical protein